MMRFMVGAEYTAQRIARYFSRAGVRQPISSPIANVGTARA
jgi:hypothetical protein